MVFSNETRKQTIHQLKHTELDLLIVGGGITGAGVAIQAAASGIKTGLIEMQDFAEGTSSRSTKLVHGGIRYLKSFDVGVVADTVKERAVVQGIAPHIPRPFPMLLPIYQESGSTFDMFSVKIAMDLYDRLAGVEGSQYANYTVTKDEVLQREPQLSADNLQGGGVYLDFVNNDAGQVVGLHVKDLLDDTEFDIHAKLVINTTGPWADKFNALDDHEKHAPTLRPTKGVHLVVDGSRLPVPQPTYMDTGLNDGRMFFVVPREGKTYFGTTDTDYTGDYEHPRVEQEDVDYLLKVVNKRFPESHMTIDDIEASWAGLRPLINDNGSSDYNGGGANSGKVSDDSFAALIEVVNAYEDDQATRADVERAISKLETAHAEAGLSPSQVSRGSSLDQATDGLITLSGGKITDYRKMAAGALALIRRILVDRFNVDAPAVDSKKLQVSGGHFDPTNVEETMAFYIRIGVDAGLSEKEAQDLANRFGSNTSRVLTYAVDGPAPGLSLKETMSLRYSLNEEMTLTPVDYLLRRTNALLFHAETLAELKQPVVDEMAQTLGWDDSAKAQQLAALNAAIANSQLAYLKTAPAPVHPE
ncbi:glycerol-3-phosphate dehydrogenase/oxidase [Lacticaseibacillus paracasei]|uniref:Alpha-glycerophosphate oxidase n=1 Tax=Lacticaseibacillus paracasei TaxID=1597 RepID=A0AAW6A5T5_LACPA|nr:glycerol-3-phosphate dehydrogenase/oxidase [Lacticaseibacillus paracasei]MDB1564313.1 glycerol-3-phosphate dehydrogenase/oxidase [Lacticaseibacillus paracasei]